MSRFVCVACVKYYTFCTHYTNCMNIIQMNAHTDIQNCVCVRVYMQYICIHTYMQKTQFAQKLFYFSNILCAASCNNWA